MPTALEFDIRANDFYRKIVTDSNNALEELRKKGVSVSKEIDSANREMESNLKSKMMPSFVAFNGIIADSGQLSMGLGQWIRAVSNNVQQFAQQTAYAVQSGGSWKDILKGIISNFTGVGGMVFAVNAVTFALQMFSSVGGKSAEDVKQKMDDLTISIADLDLELKNITRTKYLDILTEQIANLTIKQENLKKVEVDWLTTLGTLVGKVPSIVYQATGTPEQQKQAEEDLKQLQVKFKQAIDKFLSEDERANEKKKRASEKHKKEIEKIAQDQQTVLFEITQKGATNRLAIELAQLDKWAKEMKQKAHGNAELIAQINKVVSEENSKLISEQKVREIKKEIELINLKHEEGKISAHNAVIELEKIKAIAEQTKNTELLVSLQKQINSLKGEEKKDISADLKREKELQELRFDIASKGAQDRLDKELVLLNEWEQKSLKTAKDDQKLITQITDVASKERVRLQYKELENVLKDGKKYIGETLSLITQASSQESEQRIQSIEKEKEYALEAIDRKLENEKLSEEEKKELTKQRRELEKSFDREIKEEKKKAFEAERSAKAIMSVINTAEQVTAVIANPILAAIVAALGVAQTAVILSQPTPEYHRGGGAKFNAPSNEETFVKIRGGEELQVFTPEQQNQQRGNANSVIVQQMILNFNAPVQSEEFVVKALSEAKRMTGLTVEQLTSVNKNKITL